VLRRDPSLHQDRVRLLVGSRPDSRRTQTGLDMLARPRTEVGKALGPAEGRESLAVDMEVVDEGLGSVPERGLRSLAEEGIDFDSHPVVVYSWEQEGIVLGPVADHTEVVGHMELVDHTEAVGSHRNSCCSTLCWYSQN
jgi:hypothetical protein